MKPLDTAMRILAEPVFKGFARVRLPLGRRGGVSVMFGVTAVMFFSMAGLATEGGYWYLAHRNAQNAADAAALAGAITWANSGDDTATEAAVTSVANLNGFTTGGRITVRTNTHPPVFGAYSGNTAYVQAVVDQVQTLSFARLMGMNAATVTTSAVAGAFSTGPACVLTTTGSLNINGNLTINSPDCQLASNKTGSNSIDIGGSSIVNVKSMTSLGQCAGCSSNNVTPGTPYTTGVKTTNPFEALDSVAWPTFAGSSCVNNYNSVSLTPLLPYASNGNKAYCANLHLSNSTDVVTLVPGVYFFYNADFSIQNGSVTCPTCTSTAGVSIVLLGTGNSLGDLNINASATVTLNASTQASPFSALSGVLFFRQSGTGHGNSSDVTINGGATSNLSGAMYFPGARGTYNGNSNSHCTVLVISTVTMNGTANFDQTGCSTIGTTLAQIRIVKLVE